MQYNPILDGNHTTTSFIFSIINQVQVYLVLHVFIINPADEALCLGGFAGQNTHLLLSILIKHLDHRNVLKHPDMQLDIVELTTFLARQAKVEASVPIISTVSDIMRHLRKSIHCSLDDANLGAGVIKWNRRFGEVVDECLVQLSLKVAHPHFH